MSNPQLDVWAMLARLREEHPDRICDCGTWLRGRCPACEGNSMRGRLPGAGFPVQDRGKLAEWGRLGGLETQRRIRERRAARG